MVALFKVQCVEEGANISLVLIPDLWSPSTWHAKIQVEMIQVFCLFTPSKVHITHNKVSLLSTWHLCSCARIYFDIPKVLNSAHFPTLVCLPDIVLIWPRSPFLAASDRKIFMMYLYNCHTRTARRLRKFPASIAPPTPPPFQPMVYMLLSFYYPL